jgi:hypothetical protein
VPGEQITLSSRARLRQDTSLAQLTGNIDNEPILFDTCSRSLSLARFAIVVVNVGEQRAPLTIFISRTGARVLLGYDFTTLTTTTLKKDPFDHGRKERATGHT